MPNIWFTLILFIFLSPFQGVGTNMICNHRRQISKYRCIFGQLRYFLGFKILVKNTFTELAHWADSVYTTRIHLWKVVPLSIIFV